MAYVTGHPYEPRERRASGWAVAGAVMAVIAALWIVWAYAGVAELEEQANGAQAPLSTVTLADIAEKPELYAGQTVTVTGAVQEMLEPASFVLDDRVLVLNATGEPIVVQGDANLRVTGAVQVFEEKRVESELDLTLPDDVYGAWNGRPVLLATSVSDAVPVGADGALSSR